MLKNQCTFETLNKEVDIVIKSGKENFFFVFIFEYFDHLLESCGFFVCKLNYMFE